MSPSSSAFGTSAATESMTMTSTASDRTSMSVISSACSPLSGCESSRSSVFTPSLRAYPTSSACSASMKAHTPPARCASAMACRASVVFPDDSGPYTSTMRPRGSPPVPNAMSNPSDPVDTTPTSGRAPSPASPSRMMAPLPNCFSTSPSTAAIALSFWLSMASTFR